MNKQNTTFPYNEMLFHYKGDEILIHVIPWVKRENIILSERSQSQKSGFALFHLYEKTNIYC